VTRKHTNRSSCWWISHLKVFTTITYSPWLKRNKENENWLLKSLKITQQPTKKQNKKLDIWSHIHFFFAHSLWSRIVCDISLFIKNKIKMNFCISHLKTIKQTQTTNVYRITATNCTSILFNKNAQKVVLLLNRT